MMNTYTGITIGPLSKTFDKARKVKAHWSASYMFSWIMRELLKELAEKGYKVISPYYVSDLENQSLLSQVGLFPDRAIVTKEVEELEEIKADLEEIKVKVIDDLAKKIGGNSIEDVKRYLGSYIYIYDFSLACTGEAEFVKDLNARLDALELRQRAATGEDTLFEKCLAKNNGFISDYLDVQKKNGGSEKVPFETTSRIAVSGWLTDEEIEEYTMKGYEDPRGEKEVAIDYVRLSTEKRDSYRNCYKYLAVVKADGDSFGKFLKKLTAEQMEQFSEYFFDFSQEVAEELKDLKAVPVYIGGDDLFFFAPILATKQKQIFELIEVVELKFKDFRDKLAKKYEEGLFKGLEKGEAQPLTIPLTISYGVSIFYYKSPMSEAIEVADNLLFKVAKGSGRDRVAVSIHKHSGRKIEFTLPCKETTHTAPAPEGEQKKSPKLYSEALELMRSLSKDEEVMIEGLIYWLNEMLGTVVVPILQIGDKELRNKRLQALRANFFDEDIHSNYDSFLKQVFDFMYELSLERRVKEAEEILEFKQLIYGLLRYCQFITDKEER